MLAPSADFFKRGFTCKDFSHLWVADLQFCRGAQEKITNVQHTWQLLKKNKPNNTHKKPHYPSQKLIPAPHKSKSTRMMCHWVCRMRAKSRIQTPAYIPDWERKGIKKLQQQKSQEAKYKGITLLKHTSSVCSTAMTWSGWGSPAPLGMITLSFTVFPLFSHSRKVTTAIFNPKQTCFNF